MTNEERPLFRPLTVRNVTLRNRIVMSPMTRMGSPGGVPSDAMEPYYRRRAEHGVGLIVTGLPSVTPALRGPVPT